MRHLIKLARLLAATLAAPLFASDNVVTYDFESPGEARLTPRPGPSAAGITAEPIARHNLNPDNSLYKYGDSWALAAKILSNSQTQGAYSVGQTLDNATYLSVKLTVNPGRTLSLDALSFQAAAGGETGPRAFYVFSSLTGFAAEKLLLEDRMDIGGGGALPSRTVALRDGLKDYRVPLDAPPFQNIAGGTGVEFRIYIQTATPGQSIDFDNIVLSGATGAAR